MINDNLDRTMDDLNEELDKQPPAHIRVLLDEWRARAEGRREAQAPTEKVVETWEQAIAELQAASLIAQGYHVEGLQVLLQHTTEK